MWLSRPLWAEIDLDAIAHNVGEIRRHAGSHAQIIAVVKANAYGHGAVPVAQAVLEAGAQRLAVACVDEAVALRQAGITAPMLIMGYVPPWEARKVVEYGLTATVTTKQLALALSHFSEQAGVVTPVQLKVDTGMNRFGLSPDEAVAFGLFLTGLPCLMTEAIYTHFSSADEVDKSFTLKQFEVFTAIADQLPHILLRHVANSAAALDLPELALDFVRPGISLYGCRPSPDAGKTADLRPAGSLKARIVRIQDLAAGDSVSYGRTWTASQPTRVALVPCGYADGLPRLLSNRGAVLVRGQRAPIIGRICMDACIVDVTSVPGVAEDDEVVIFGRQGDAVIPVEEVAAQAGTISYEVLCAIGARVPRVYRRGGRVVRIDTLLGEQDISPEMANAFP